jgi:hypothetical protein
VLNPSNVIDIKLVFAVLNPSNAIDIKLVFAASPGSTLRY